MEREWEFLRDARRRWYWRYTSPDGTNRVSVTFETYDQCVDNAMTHGYEPEKDPAESKDSAASTQPGGSDQR